MAKKKRKGLGLFRLLLLVLLVVLIVLVVILIVKNNLTLDKKQDEIVEKTDINDEEDLNKIVSFTCDKYDVYLDEDDKLGFNFIIAELTFDTTKDSLYYDLGYIITSEKIRLNSCQYYLDTLESLRIDVKQFNLLDNEITSENTSMKGNVFIPFTKEVGSSLSIYNGGRKEFDVKSHTHSIKELLFEIETEDIKTDKYDIEISNPHIESFFVTSDTKDEFNCPYALSFELTVLNITSNNVYIENAKYIPDGAVAGEYYECLDDHVDSLIMPNIINKKLKKGDKFGLFFQISEDVNTKGVIMIKFSDSDKWMELREG